MGSALTTVIIIIQVICAVALIAVITLQSGKGSGLSGVINGSADTFLGKGKGKSLDARLASATKWIAGAFVLLTFILTLL